MPAPIPETVYLAPFQGITDAIFRTSLARYFCGVDAVFTPYISGTGVEKVSKNKLVDVMPDVNRGIRTIPQMLSKDAAEMLLLAQSLVALGYDEVNWNLGCPFPRVARKLRGSGMLPHPDLVGQVLTSLFSNDFPMKLSVKMRTGYNHHDEIHAMMEVLNQFPLSEVIIHPRTGKQLYKGDASPEAFQEVLPLVKHPVAWNGDIFSVGKYIDLQSRFPSVKRWMIGRGALMNPALPLALKNPDAHRQLDIRKAITLFLYDIYQVTYHRNEGRTAVVSRMKSVWVNLCESFEDPVNVFRIIRKTRTPDEYLDAERRVLDEFDLKRE